MKAIRTLQWLVTVLFAMDIYAEELLPWKSNRHPTDVSKQHVQEISAGRAEYRVEQHGTMDGRNCRSPQGVWTPFEQTWESNRSVRMENVGETEIVNPWLSNGRNDFRSMAAIVARAVEPGMSDQEKAMSLWWQQIQYRFHYQGDNNELLSPVKVLNVYGHDTCGNDSICLAGLWKTAGLKVAPARLVGHCVTQVFYDGGWHLFDGDMHSIYLLRDNETIAGEQDLVRDHDLIKRTHTQGILRPQGRAGDEWESSIYVFEGDVSGDRNADRDPAMNMTLRPGEALVWRWGHTDPARFFGSTEHQFVDRVCNGLWEYRPDFSHAIWREGVESIENIQSDLDGLKAENGRIGEIVWSIRTPYVLVGGRLEVQGTEIPFEISWDKKSWISTGSDLDPHFPRIGTARYQYFLRCRLDDSARLRGLKIQNDLQMAPLTLPEMTVGENHFTYSDDSTTERRIRITHAWVECSASVPPSPPTMPIRPCDRGDVEGTDVVFEWQPAMDADGEKIADYHFELSARADMKWPLSMSFAKLISRTSDAGSHRFTLKAPGELTPDREYYWHVRAKDESGVWGNWSDTWRFTARGPSPPLDVSVDYDPTSNRGTLRWKPNPVGRQPVSYRVYASDEKGFSASDLPFSVAGGIYDVDRKQSTGRSTQFAANFLAEVSGTALSVLGQGVELSGANKSYYRVVAVDKAGNRSGPSDYASAPRPVIHSRPVERARIGVAYRYDVQVVRAIGDLRTRVVDGREVMNYWDVEKPRFQLERGPEWLRLDKSTGQITGTPESAGRYEIVVTVNLESERRRLDPSQLQWGVEKTMETRRESVGVARQAFAIDVSP
jgi:hypothetical protein